MKSSTKLFLNIFLLLLVSSNSQEQIELTENTLKEIELKSNETKIILPISATTFKKMTIELVLSHPSNYLTTFVQYDQESEPAELFSKSSELDNLPTEEAQNLNTFYLNEENMFIHPKRRLSTVNSENQTDLIEKDELLFGKNKVTLKLNEEMKKILIYKISLLDMILIYMIKKA